MNFSEIILNFLKTKNDFLMLVMWHVDIASHTHGATRQHHASHSHSLGGAIRKVLVPSTLFLIINSPYWAFV